MIDIGVLIADAMVAYLAAKNDFAATDDIDAMHNMDHWMKTVEWLKSWEEYAVSKPRQQLRTGKRSKRARGPRHKAK